jgi:hypothetical protein
MKFQFTLILQLSLVSSLVFAKGEPSKGVTPRISPEFQSQEEFKSWKIWAGVPVGAFGGFGLGHIVQGRWSITGYGWVYTIVDFGAVMLMFTTSYGDCGYEDTACSDRQDQRKRFFQNTLIASRIVQTADLSIWSYKYYRRFYPTGFYFLPERDKASIVATFSF